MTKDFGSIINELGELLNPLYVVGGTVRDEMIGRSTIDIDLATPILADEVERQLKSKKIKTYSVGKQFGTIAIKIDAFTVQITTFRGEAYAPGSRRPAVHFVDNIDIDLARRDFTINAMAKKGNKLIDPFGGAIDIKKRIIRSVGNPGERFAEDPLRMLRAYRFSSELGFNIEPKTKVAINNNSKTILNISKERIAIELDKILLGDHLAQVLETFIDSELFKYLLPELYLIYVHNKPNITFSNNKSIFARDEGVTNKWLYLVRLLLNGSDLLLDDTFILEIINRIALYYKWSNARINLVNELMP